MVSKLDSNARGMDFFTSEEILKNYFYLGINDGRIKRALERFESFWPDQQETWYGKGLTIKIRAYLKNAETLE